MKLNSNSVLSKIPFRYLLFLFVSLLNTNSFSQPAQACEYCDSLETLIANTPSDTAKARLNYLLMKKLLRTDVDKALLIAKQGIKYAINSGSEHSIAKAYDGLGLSFDYKYEFDSALVYYKKALEIHLKLKDVLGVIADYGDIGTVYLEESNYPEGLDYLLKALQLMEVNEQKYSNDKRFMTIKANTLGNLGILYLSINKYEKALEYDKKALEVFKKMNDTRNEISTLNTIANIYYTQKKYDQSLEIQRDIIVRNRKLNDPYMDAMLYGNMGNSFKESGQLDSALVKYKMGMELSENLQDLRGLAIVYHNIGEIYFQLNDKEKSLFYINKSLSLSLSSKYPDLSRDNYQLLYRYYNEKGDHEKALSNFKSYIELRDTLFNEDNTRKTVQSEMTYEFDKKNAIAKAQQDSKDLLVSQQQQRERIVRNAFIVGFALVLLLVLVVFRGYRQKQKANSLLAEQKKEIEEQKTQIEDSIDYARYIQRAILPSENNIIDSFKDIFGYYKPKDVVSGDFYWFAKHDDKTLIAVADCTGHGVPGAFMSLIGSDKLNQIVQEKGITKPSDILSSLNKGVKKTLKQNEEHSVSRDGMDIALCSFDLVKLKMEYAGANRPLYLIRNNQIREYVPTKSAIAGLTEDNKQFDNHIIDLQEGDKVYIFSDGFVDQFGGTKSKKYMTKRFKETLLAIHQKPMKEQESALDVIFNEWKGKLEQVDDILIIGIAI